MYKTYIIIAAAITTLSATTAMAPVASAATTTTIAMTSEGFEPKDIVIALGDTVVFKNNDSEYRWPASNIHPTHNIYPEFDPKGEIAPGGSWEFRFDQAGTWKYHDHILPQFGGTIVVQDTNATVDNDAATQENKPGFWSKVGHWFGNLWYRMTHWGKAKPKNDTNNTNNTSKGVDISKYNQDIAEGADTIFSDDTALGSYLKKYGPHKTITALRLLEPKFGSCHQPAHRAGHMGYALFVEKAFVEYSAECQSGYYHGVMEAYFKEHGADNIAESLDSLCKGGLNNFFEHQCVHGIGHGLVAWTNYGLPEALAACDQLPRRQDSCWTGAFMENLSAQLATGNKASSVDPLSGSKTALSAAGNTDVHVTKYLKADDALYPCNGVDEKYQNSCYFLQTSRMLQIFGQDFKKVAESCSQAPSLYQASCFGSMGRDVGGNFPTDNARQIRECGYVSTESYRINCLDGAVQNSFWDPTGQTQAIDFCTRLTKPEEKQSCYNTIIGRANELLTNTDGKEQFCESIETAYRETCKAQLAYAK